MMTLLSHFTSYFAASGCDPNRTFFGLPVWYKYLDVAKSAGPCNLSGVKVWPPNDLLMVGLAIVDGVLRLAGLVAVVIVLYGGFLYVTSSGEPDKTKQALSTIINAFIGLAISLLAVTFVAFFGNRLGG